MFFPFTLVHYVCVLLRLMPLFLFFHRDRLIANDFIQVRKVAEHVLEKVLGAGSESGSVAAGPATTDKEAEDVPDSNSLAEEKVELLCNDLVSTMGQRDSVKCFKNVLQGLTFYIFDVADARA